MNINVECILLNEKSVDVDSNDLSESKSMGKVNKTIRNLIKQFINLLFITYFIFFSFHMQYRIHYSFIYLQMNSIK